jgi:glycosyltransferase involved in cell wall biosynthesis
MRVLHVAPYASPAYGGPGVVIRSMARALYCRGAEVAVVTTNAAGDRDLSLQDGAICLEDGVQFRYFNRQFPRGWFRAPGMDRWLQDHVGHYDLLHLHVPFTAPFRAGARAARAAGRPYVATLHGVLDPWSLRHKAWKKKPYLRILERGTLAEAATLHVTAALEQSFVNAMCLGPLVRCLPLAVPLPPSPLRAPRLAGRARVLCIARLHPVKALPVLFAALARLRADGCDVFLDLAGQGEADYVAKLRQQAQSLGIEQYIAWHGHVDAVQKEHLYAAADCFALLSHHENFGLSAAEAMAVGVPVVVSDQVGLAPDVLAFQAGSVVPAGDDVAAARAMRRLLEPTESANAGARARQLVQQCYGEAAFAEGLIEMYQAALSNG